MKKERNNWIEAAPDAILGYCAVILGIMCFILMLTVVVAVVRLLVGMGAA